MNKNLLPFFSLILTPGLAWSESYQYELGTQLTKEQTEYSYNGNRVSKTDDTGVLFSGKYYFTPVNVKGYPLAEAAFLQGVSNIGLEYGYAEGEQSHFVWTNCEFCDPQIQDTKVHTGKVSAEVYIPNTVFYLAGAFNYTDYHLTRQSGETASGSSNHWWADVGVRPTEGLLIYSRFHEDVTPFEDSFNLSSKYVRPLGGGRAINLEASYYYEKDYDDYWTLGGDFYFTPNFSVGAEYREDETYQVRTEKFFAPKVGAGLYYQSHRDWDHHSYSEVGLSLKVRF